MFYSSEIPRDTIQAYLETHYHVRGGAPTTLKIGETNATLADLHRAAGVESSAFITACNTFSDEQPPEVNVARQQELARVLAHRGLTYIDGIGEHPTNGWGGEASFLALGLALDDAIQLGKQHGQNAIVWSDVDAVPQLILLR
ncbi:DUF3293 domain-containing protein [Paraburkholderia sp. MM5477-R1]|uniref:DUF3293 domain-containing protein n=1 Tax=Paraburkholderia sp. MM5477-R1 TaxID=2991062 RepID=UPI003D2580D3